MANNDSIVEIIRQDYPEVQAIYLFGSWGTEYEWPSSDVDIAVLLPPDKAKRLHAREHVDTQVKLASVLRKDVDLINLRQVSTVLQKEVVMADRRIYTADLEAAEEFEILVLALYQKLNQERAEILAEGLRSGTFYNI